MNPLASSLCLAVTAVILLHACGGEDAVTPQASSRPVKTFLVAGSEGGGQRSFPGRIESTNRADLSFRVAGTLQEILVKEGDLVEQGQLLAKLDPTDYETVVRDRQATYDNSERNFERAKEEDPTDPRSLAAKPRWQRPDKTSPTRSSRRPSQAA